MCFEVPVDSLLRE
jgi:hypothetical protein